MDIYLPSLAAKTNADKLQKKVIKYKIVKGIYTGYNLLEDIVVVLIKGHDGWNLFTNPSSDHIADALYFIIKNKTSILFLMENMGVRTINIKESNR